MNLESPNPETMTPAQMDEWAARVYGILITSKKEAEAKAVFQLGAFIRELGRRLEEQGHAIQERETTEISLGEQTECC